MGSSKRWLLPLMVAALLAAGIFMFGVNPTGLNQQSNLQLAPKAPTATAEPKEHEQKQAAPVRIHKVESGETLSDIANKYNLDVETLTAANPGISSTIHPGDELVILPAKGILYTVEYGDTLWGIANAYGVTVESIASANHKENTEIMAGEKLFIPGGRLQRAAQPASRATVARFLWPARGELTSFFGYRWGRLHAGVDIANDIGTAVHAARAGRVSFAGWLPGYGYTVMIDHNQEYTTLYGHLADYSVEVGQYVQAGQKIADMGNSGNSTGPHLHFEVRVSGNPVNPLGFLP